MNSRFERGIDQLTSYLSWVVLIGVPIMMILVVRQGTNPLHRVLMLVGGAACGAAWGWIQRNRVKSRVFETAGLLVTLASISLGIVQENVALILLGVSFGYAWRLLSLPRRQHE